VQIGTLALIGLSGLGNWFTTNTTSDRNRAQIEINRAASEYQAERVREDVRKQILDIHDWINDSKSEFHQGNVDSAENRKLLLSIVNSLKNDLAAFEQRQHDQLANQTQMLANQTEILTEIHKITANYDTYKRNEQMRGAP